MAPDCHCKSTPVRATKREILKYSHYGADRVAGRLNTNETYVL